MAGIVTMRPAADVVAPSLNRLRSQHSKAVERLQAERLQRGQPTAEAYAEVEALEAKISKMMKGDK